MKAVLVAGGMTAATLFGGAVYFANGLLTFDAASKSVADRLGDKDGVEQSKTAEATFYTRIEPLYAILSPALEHVQPSIDEIVDIKDDAVERERLVALRRAKVQMELLGERGAKDAATSLFSEFDSAAACLNSGRCATDSWHASFDGAFCGAQRTYADFVDLQHRRLPTFASDFIKTVGSIDCSKLLYG